MAGVEYRIDLGVPAPWDNNDSAYDTGMGLRGQETGILWLKPAFSESTVLITDQVAIDFLNVIIQNSIFTRSKLTRVDQIGSVYNQATEEFEES